MLKTPSQSVLNTIGHCTTPRNERGGQATTQRTQRPCPRTATSGKRLLCPLLSARCATSSSNNGLTTMPEENILHNHILETRAPTHARRFAGALKASPLGCGRLT